VCVWNTSFLQLDCILTVNGDTTPGELNAISSYNSNHLVVWGTDGGGNDFCCTIDDPSKEVEALLSVGTSQNDVMRHLVEVSGVYHELAEPHPNGFFDAFLLSSYGDDTLYGSNRSSAYFTEDLWGNEGDDYLDAGKGPANLYGFGGDDQLVGGNGDDYLHGGEGSDDLQGGPGDDVMNGHDDADTMTGGGGDDTMHGGEGDDTLIGGGGDDTMNGDSGNDNLAGGPGTDTMHGGDDNDTIYGNGGWDGLQGGNGDDILRGGKGDDSVCDREGDDQLYGGDGSDSLWYEVGGGSGPGASDEDEGRCNELPLYFNWAGQGCTYNLQTRPSTCPSWP